MTPSLNIYTDGGSRGNPGPAAVGVVIRDDKNKIIHQFSQTIGTATNNVAEYQGVIFALKYLIVAKLNPSTINFFLDSSLVVNQLNGLWKIKDENLKKLVSQVKELETVLATTINYTAIPREKNSQADSLLNQALDSSIQ